MLNTFFTFNTIGSTFVFYTSVKTTFNTDFLFLDTAC